MEPDRSYTAFAGERMIGSGPVATVLRRVKTWLAGAEKARLLIFEDETGRQVDFDLRGTTDEVLARLATHPHFAADIAARDTRMGPGRPKLGVVCREVSLLPRHWDWLEQQPNGISAALRRLVDDARKREPGKDRARRLRDAAGQFMSVMAGDLPGFEEATRALYANDRARLDELTQRWPRDIRRQMARLVDRAEVAARGAA